MSQSYLMIDVNDERASALAEILSNKTCKKIIQLLSEKELSETEISNALKSPANTVNYNVKKLMDSGLIEKANKFWSVKGKSVSTYKISNKKILISPRPMVRGVLPVAIITGLVALGISKLFSVASNTLNYSNDVYSVSSSGAGVASGMMKVAAPSIAQQAPDRVTEAVTSAGTVVTAGSGIGPWAWFLLGAWISILLFVGWQVWKK